MATFAADKVRAAAIELQNKARTLYQAVLPIYRASGAWTLNGLDTELPVPFDLKVQIEAYKALKLELLKLDWTETLRQAVPGDTSTYPPPPSGSVIIFDETITFSESLIF